MKRNAFVLAIAVLAPAAAMAATGIANSVHDLSAGSAASVKSTTETETCKFCHTPHHAKGSHYIFNKTRSTASYTYSDNASGKTAGGTLLPTSLVGYWSALCMGCHDGTVAIGDVANAGDGVAGIIPNVTSSKPGSVIGGFLAAGAMGYIGTDLAKNHPIGVPYAGQSFTRNGTAVTSGIPASQVGTGYGGYWPVAAGVTQPGSGVAGIVLAVGDKGQGVGIECSTCHDVHNSKGNEYLTIVNNTQSSLCRGCHAK